MSRVVLLIAVTVAAMAQAQSANVNAKWPAVRALHTKVEVADVARGSLSLPIKGTDGVELYRLECRGGGQETPEFDYSGDFECRLVTKGGRQPFKNLAATHPDAKDWENRLRFFSDELQGTCLNNEVVGSIRQMSLRGMSLKISLKDLKFDGDRKLTALTMHVDVLPDPNARGSIAGEASVPEPALLEPGKSMRRVCGRAV